MSRTLSAVLSGLIMVVVPVVNAIAADSRTRDQRFGDERSRTVERSLKDLSNRNDASVGSIRETPRPPSQGFSGNRVELHSDPTPSTAALLRDDIDSGLHRLRRETASRNTEDGRQARVNESLDRQMTEALSRSAEAGAAPRSIPRTSDPEFSSIKDARFDLRPEDHPANTVTAQSDIESSLHQLRREPIPDPSDENTPDPDPD